MQMMKNTNINWYHRDTCPACSGKKWNRLLHVNFINLFKCASCGMRFLNPCLDEFSTAAIYQTSDTLKEINPFLEHYYEESAEDVSNSITGRDFKAVLDWLSKKCSGNYLLDVASGNGTFLAFAKNNGWLSEGIDPSLKNAEMIKEKFDIPVNVTGFLEFDRFAPKYDAITFWDFIEHPPKPSLYVQKAKNHLKEDGVLVLATPNVNNLLNHTAELIYKVSRGAVSFPAQKMYTIEHASYFNFKTIKCFLNENGFKIVHHFKTESNLSRYHLSFTLKTALKGFFFLNRLLNLQNRLIIFAVRN